MNQLTCTHCKSYLFSSSLRFQPTNPQYWLWHSQTSADMGMWHESTMRRCRCRSAASNLIDSFCQGHIEFRPGSEQSKPTGAASPLPFSGLQISANSASTATIPWSSINWLFLTESLSSNRAICMSAAHAASQDHLANMVMFTIPSWLIGYDAV